MKSIILAALMLALPVTVQAQESIPTVKINNRTFYRFPTPGGGYVDCFRTGRYLEEGETCFIPAGGYAAWVNRIVKQLHEMGETRIDHITMAIACETVYGFDSTEALNKCNKTLNTARALGYLDKFSRPLSYWDKVYGDLR